MRHLSVLVFILSICLLRPLYAAEETASVNMNIPSICKLTISNSDQTIDLVVDASGEAAYEAGYINGNNNRPKLIVDSNTNWKLSVKVSSDWNIVGSYQKATQDLMLKVTSGTGHQTDFSGGFTPLSLIEQEIATHVSGVSNDVYKCRYRIILDWEKDIPGNYTIIAVYTLSTQF